MGLPPLNIQMTLAAVIGKGVWESPTVKRGYPIGAHNGSYDLMKLQRLQNKVLRTIGKFPRRTPVRELHTAFQLPNIYEYITKLCRQQAQVILNHENENVHNIGQGKARHRKYKKLKLGGSQTYDRSSD
jgi:hypothetical protein